MQDTDNQSMTDEMEREGTRERNTRMVELMRDSETFLDFGRMCGKSEKENPLINWQLQLLKAAAVYGVGLVARCYFSFFSYVASFLL